ncbi:hypothetical protein EJ04DRAFT_1336 [Polyplosphaeria fusca]|uniref:Rhodopsin domain-containing protein n=1 Tax=Polyplosphaeria fusca TaxID=682080 RepID=A0A9P4R914_9PLEO|nr:hypothetical protein EJ04DRAFT_1336 [Polyplosphaeria fusca]
MAEKEIIALVFCVFLLVLSLAFVAARLYVRCVMLKNAGKDDVFCVIAAFLSIVETAFMFIEIEYGAGKRISELSGKEIEKQRFAVFISMPPYYVELMFIKISIIYQYRRFFLDSIALICYLLLAFVVSTTISFVLLSALQCNPVEGFWKPTPTTKCLDLAVINYSFLAVNAFTDIVLLLLPMPTFWNLKLRSAEKKALIGIFALGGFAALTSILRIPAIAVMQRGGDPGYNGFSVIVWTRIEMGVSVICACLPCLRAPLARWFPNVWGQVTKIGSRGSRRESQQRRSSFALWRQWQKHGEGVSRLESRSGNESIREGADVEEREIGMLEQEVAVAPSQNLPRDGAGMQSGKSSFDKAITVTTTTQHKYSEPFQIPLPEAVGAIAWSDGPPSRSAQSASLVYGKEW